HRAALRAMHGKDVQDSGIIILHRLISRPPPNRLLPFMVMVWYGTPNRSTNAIVFAKRFFAGRSARAHLRVVEYSAVRQVGHSWQTLLPGVEVSPSGPAGLFALPHTRAGRF
ncbi:MAG: hypothetical protein QME60_09185, partial [Verrucomicrobiota bacterium]|nr:hypothetical protein [Verrucomicrobiota bacterium]